MSTFAHPYHLDDFLPDLDLPLTADETLRTELGDGDVWDHLAALYRPVRDRVASDVRGGRRPIIMSGDCTTSYGVVAGIQHAGADPAIVWFDAHGDVQTLETTESGYIGGMPLRFLTGYRNDLVADRIGLTPIDESRVVLAGARDIDPPEAEYLANAPVHQADVDDIGPDVIPDGPIYLHVDFDVVNPDDLPGLLYPATGGPSLSAVGTAIARVIATGRVAAVGLACTWHGGHDAASRVSDVVKPLAS